MRKTLDMAIARLSLNPPRADRPAPSSVVSPHQTGSLVPGYEQHQPYSHHPQHQGLPQQFPAYGSPHMNSYNSGAQQHHQGRTYQNNALQPGPGEVTAHMHVPKERVGSIMGTGGANIDQIRQMSGTRVRVHMEDNGSGMKLVENVGTPEQTEAAKQLVSSFVNNIQQR